MPGLYKGTAGESTVEGFRPPTPQFWGTCSLGFTCAELRLRLRQKLIVARQVDLDLGELPKIVDARVMEATETGGAGAFGRGGGGPEGGRGAFNSAIENSAVLN